MIRYMEENLRAGHFGVVRTQFSRVSLSKAPRKHLSQIANIAWRIGLYRLALRVLNPYVRSEPGTFIVASAAERLEYAISLQKIGAADEAYEILKTMDAKTHPLALLYMSFCHMSSWDYASTIPLLLEFTASPLTTPYQRIVGKVNLLAASIITDQIETAEQLLREIGKTTKDQNLRLLYGNSLELAAQMAISQKKWREAEQYLEQAKEFLGSDSSVNSLFIDKWQAVLKAHQNPKALSNLHSVKTKALRDRHWETARDCDFHIVVTSKDLRVFEHLYYGTPYPSYRERVLRLANMQSPPSHFVYTPGKQSSTPNRVFDLETARERDGTWELRAGQVLHRLFVAIYRDWYRPLRVGQAFAVLFPDEYFNPATSVDRVHQAVKRLRESLLDREVPIEVLESHGAYQLSVGADYGVRVPADPLPLEGKELEMRQLKSIVETKEFTSREARVKLGVSHATMNRLINWAQDHNKIIRLGSGTKTKYRIAG
ncbi:MAG: hypothetical protein H6624_17245 [Bdellovibrionaceae bacterium]|nr:hypothetical protein [Bdellovibrionales bacterium]MCB9086089.1 hypothetical protein [Pseudobdellovibrionaceae bacterium]